MQVSTRDLRLRTRELMAATARGEKIIITYRGKPKAVMESWNGQEANDGGGLQTRAQKRNPACGIWRDKAEEGVDETVRKLRWPRHPHGTQG